MFAGHNRLAFAAGAAAYAVGATALELVGYSMQVGRGPALSAILPAAFQPVAGTDGYVDRPGLVGLDRYLRKPAVLSRDGRIGAIGQMYLSPMHPLARSIG
jgi:hypothetical protein